MNDEKQDQLGFLEYELEEQFNFISIDPGKTGAMALMRLTIDTLRPADTARVELVDWIDINYSMEPIETQSLVDTLEIQQKVHDWSVSRWIHQITIEQQRPHGGQLNSGTTSNLINYGALLGILAAGLQEGASLGEVAPRSWQSKLYSFKRGEKYTKELGIDTCTQYGISIPTRTSRSNSPIHDGLSDAVLIGLSAMTSFGLRTDPAHHARKAHYGR